MRLTTLLCSVTLGLTGITGGLSVQAQALTPAEQAAADAQLVADCQEEANRNNDECLLLPPVEAATNFAFAVAPFLPIAAAVGLVAAAAGGGSSTPNTTPAP